MTELDVTVETAVLGEQVDVFMRSRVGEYIQKRADDRANTAYAQLKSCDPFDSRQIQSLQNEIRIAESIISWMGEAVEDGLRALEILDDRGE